MQTKTTTTLTAAAVLLAITGCSSADKPMTDAEWMISGMPTSAPASTGRETQTPPASDPGKPDPAEEKTETVLLGKPGQLVPGVTMTVLEVKPNLRRNTKKFVGILVDFHNTSGKIQNVANSWDFNIVDSEGQSYEFDYVYDGPSPQFQGSRDVQSGRHAKGWMIYQQPTKLAGSVFQYQSVWGSSDIVDFQLFR